MPPRAQNCPDCRGTPPPSAAKPRRCCTCKQVKPAEAFPYRSTRRPRREDSKIKRRSGTCADCWAEREREAEERRAQREMGRRTWRNESGRLVRRCSGCKQVKGLTRRNFYLIRSVPKGQRPRPVDFGWHCKPCTTARTTEINRRRANDPVTREEMRAKRRAWQREWRRKNPEAYRAAQRRWRAKAIRDPEMHARMLENARIQHRLRRERAGLPVREPRPNELETSIGSNLPAKPLANVIERYVNRRQALLLTRGVPKGESREVICEELGITSRTLRDWRSGGRRYVRAGAADVVLTALGLHWWDVWHCDEHATRQPGCEACEGDRLAAGAFGEDESEAAA